MTETATKPKKARKPNVGSDPTKGSRVKLWQVGVYAFAIGGSGTLLSWAIRSLLKGNFPRILIIVSLLFAGLSWGLVTAKSQAFKAPVGTKVGEAEPALLAFIQEIAAHVNAPMPDEVFLVTEAECRLREQTRFFGRTVDRQVLVIGLPYVQALSRRELAAMIAHELAHLGEIGVLEGPRAIRSLGAARHFIAIERQGFVNGIYGSYARKMYRSVGGVGIAQEEAADRVAVDAYGTTALVSALGRYDEIVVAFDQLLREYVVPALQNQVHPVNMFAGFDQVVQSPVRAEARARHVERRQAKERNEFDLHRTPVERIAMIEAWPAQAGTADLADADSPAHTLLDPAAKSEDIVVASWATKLMGHRTEPQTWQQLTDEIYSIRTHDIAGLAFDEDVDPAAQLDQLYRWAKSSDWHSVDEALELGMSNRDTPQVRRAEWAQCVVAEAAAARSTCSWEHNWDGDPVLRCSSGAAVDAEPVASLLLDGKVDDARAAFAAATK